MAYTDYTLEALKTQFGLQTNEQEDYFAQAPPTLLSQTLRDHLDRFVPLALAIGTEKARSELIITPVLLEIFRHYTKSLSFFSGIEFSPDPERGLRGVCDYLLSLSPEQLTVEAPVVAVVEAKNENIKAGFSQCIAEMVAAQTFNQAKGNTPAAVYGVVTTGSVWRFLRLKTNIVFVDRSEYHISQADKVVGILLAMLQEAASAT